MIWKSMQHGSRTKLKTIDYDIHWASQEKEKILNTWETLQGRTDEKVD